ncbi:MAG: hypothetical protein KGJ86_01950 [Chloroflexota bacterium]|nr:hypothetical protein [Chloroflexota bacterium]
MGVPARPQAEGSRRGVGVPARPQAEGSRRRVGVPARPQAEGSRRGVGVPARPQAESSRSGVADTGLNRLPRQAALGSMELGFLRLSVAALMVAGVFAFVVSIARTPLVVLLAGSSYLFTALVGHVTFALNVWLLSSIALMWTLLGVWLGLPLPPRWTAVGLGLAWAGATLLAASPLAGIGSPVMADYVPVLLTPLFVAGLVSFGGGIGLVAAAYLKGVAGARRGVSGLPVEAGLAGISAVVLLAALATFPLSIVRWGTVDIASAVWDGGHLLQAVNASAMVACWVLLGPPLSPRQKGLVRLGCVGFLLSLTVVGVVQFSAIPWASLASLFWSGVGIPVVMAWLILSFNLVRELRGGERPAHLPFLLISLAMFAAGGLISLTGLASDTRVTAHYHGTVGAVTMAFMGLAYAVLPRFGIDLAWKKLSRFEPYLYGGGLLMIIVGLFWAGEAGATRKTFESMSANPALIVPAALFGLGAVATVAGGVVFVCGIGTSLLRGAEPGAERDRTSGWTAAVAPVQARLPYQR